MDNSENNDKIDINLEDLPEESDKSSKRLVINDHQEAKSKDRITNNNEDLLSGESEVAKTPANDLSRQHCQYHSNPCNKCGYIINYNLKANNCCPKCSQPLNDNIGLSNGKAKRKKVKVAIAVAIASVLFSVFAIMLIGEEDRSQAEVAKILTRSSSAMKNINS